ncbi:MAG: hypothetical protein EBV64_14735 [Oxalobacteraceae bacterium]|nr:hypothetical protein [Oxalobacteraceae bacterium]
MPALYATSIKSLPLLSKGKVRDVYALGDDKLLMITTDRLSAFDVVMGEPIPEKGVVLNQMANFWFEKLGNVIPNHLTGIDPATVVAPDEVDQVRGRAVVAKRLKPILVEAVVRGYLAGSGWKEPDGSQLGAIRHSSSNLVTLSGPITLANNARIHTSGAGNLAISGVIDDGVNSFGLEKTGYYGLTLTAANTFGGDTVIRGGKLYLNNQTGPALYNAPTGSTERPSGTVRINNDNSTGSNTSGGYFVGVHTLAANQLGSNVNVSFDGTSYTGGWYNEFALDGFSQTIGNLLDAGGQQRNLIQLQNSVTANTPCAMPVPPA